MARGGKFPDKWRPIYDVLIGIRNELDKLSLTQAWSLRETDLYDYQRQLDKIDESRVDGNWLDDEGQPADLYVQRVCTSTVASEKQLSLSFTNRRCRLCYTSFGGRTDTSIIL